MRALQRVGRTPRTARRLVQRLAVVGAMAVAIGGTADAAAALAGASVGGHPASVFASKPTLAIEAARSRLALFVAGHPAPAPTAQVAPSTVPCPLISAESLGAAATAVSADLRLDADPWLASTSRNPELRPDSTPAGSAGGLTVVTCAADRPIDPTLTRPSLFAISLAEGVSFGDVVRAYGLDGVLRVVPARIGGEMAGSCLATVATSLCVVLWQSQGLVVGVTMEGPPAAVNTTTAGALLADAVPSVLDTLAVVHAAAPACDAAEISADTTIVLLAEPACNDGWALGSSAPCPTDPSVPCVTREAFHLEASGWKSDGAVTVDCAENIARLGMTGLTAQQFVAACNASDGSLAGGSIRPEGHGQRVEALQISLVSQGYVLPVDGRYGPLTEAAVYDFQQSHALTIDGVAGPQTQSALGI